MSNRDNKTDRSESDLQMKILRILLVSPQPSMYKLRKNITGASFSTVRRNLYKLQEVGLIGLGKPENRNAICIQLTPKGIATLLIEGDLKKEDLVVIQKKSLRQMLSHLSPKEFLEIEPFMLETFSQALLNMKPKVNLQFFDEKYFRELYQNETWTAIAKAIQKFKAEYERKGIWATDEERQKDARAYFSDDLFENIASTQEE